jgi:RNA polymerase sigma-70 factor (ECF subfamily)
MKVDFLGVRADFLSLSVWPVNMEKTLPDEELMAKTAEGDEYAFEILARRHQTSVLNLIYRYVGDRTQAKDLAQEVFVRVWQAAKTYKPTAKFTTWIYRITANLCLNELKASGRRKWISRFSGEEGQEVGVEAFSDESPSAEDLLLAGERSRQITDALQSLPENQRMAVILKKFDDLSYQEIARILDCSVSAVESLLVRGKRNLQEKLLLPEK